MKVKGKILIGEYVIRCYEDCKSETRRVLSDIRTFEELEEDIKNIGWHKDFRGTWVCPECKHK